MLKAVVIDDEIAAIRQFEKLAAKNNGIDILAAFTSPLEGLESIKQLQPQVIFLDISMPEMSGIYLAEQIVKACPGTDIVFITSHNEYALKAFELNALDYLLKPLTEERFSQCIQKLIRSGSKGISRESINNLNNSYKESAKRLFVDSDEETVLIRPEDIYFFEVNDKTVLIKTFNKSYKSSNSLSYFEAKLQNSNFYRCHRSYLVNLDKVSRIIHYSRTNCEAGFSDIKDTVPVSKNNISELKILLEY